MLNEEFEKFLNVLKTVDIETRIHNARHLKFGYFNMMLFEKEEYKKQYTHSKMNPNIL